jgi:hypothetical protein
MDMKQTLDAINRMEADGIIGRYAIAGAVATYCCMDTAVNGDLDILIPAGAPESGPQSGLIEGRAVRFLLVADALDAEALAEADEVPIESDQGLIKTRVLRPEYIVASALRVGRPKDRLNIIQFLEEEAVDPEAVFNIIGKHGIEAAWRTVCEFDISDILKAKAERRHISRRSFGEKIAMMEALREDLAPFKRLREQRRAAKHAAEGKAADPHK